MLEKPLADTVGIELEFQNLNGDQARQCLSRLNLDGYFSVHGDASINNQRMRLLSYDLADFSFSFDENFRTNNTAVAIKSSGAEIVSIPIDTTDLTNWKDMISRLLEYTATNYYEFPGEKTSVHFHINSRGLPIWAVQNVLRLWLQIEAPMYRLGIGELEKHRGELPGGKDYLYCRPVRSPQVINSNRGSKRYSYSVDKMLKARNLREFFWAYGNVDIDGNPHKYHPARYSAINFFSLNSIGTIEFRVFNMITNPNLIFGLLNVCQQVVRLSMGKPLEFSDERVLGYNGRYNFGEFVDKLELDTSSGLVLQKAWYNSNWCSGVQNNLFTHSSHNSIRWTEKQLPFMPSKVNSYRVYDELGSFTDIDNDSNLEGED